MRAIARHVGSAGPRQQSALRPRVTRAGGHIIGVEQECEFGIVRTVGRDVRRQNELLKEPGRVAAMPFDWTSVGHRLDDLIFRRQWRGPPLGLGPYRTECLQPSVPCLAAVISGRARLGPESPLLESWILGSRIPESMTRECIVLALRIAKYTIVLKLH
jgi:hypothetical protein